MEYPICPRCGERHQQPNTNTTSLYKYCYKQAVKSLPNSKSYPYKPLETNSKNETDLKL